MVSAAVLLTLAGCSSTPSHPSGATTTPPTASTTAPALTSTTSHPTTAPPGPSTGFPSNEAAAEHLVDAWRNHDKGAALQGATSQAVDTMLAIPVGSLNVRGCDAGDFGTSSCVYRLLTNQWEIRLDLERRPAGWVVVDVQYSPPTP